MPTVLVPFRPDGAERDRAWAHLSGRWAALGWEVIVGSCPDGPWVKASAVADALSRAAGDVLVLADADVWVPGVVDAVAAVEAGAPWAVPHTLVHRLTKGATDVMLGREVFGGPLIEQRVEQRPYVGMVGGGCTVVRRDVYEACPLDPRFEGWGQEDAAWGVALTAMSGPPWRSTEPLWHLWHPPMDRAGLTPEMASGECAPPRGTGSLAGRRLLAEYAKAAGEGRMSEFLAQREVEATREPIMWRYRNSNSGDIYEFPSRNDRLDRLGNWVLIEQPAPQPLREDDFRRTLTAGPAVVEVPASDLGYVGADGSPMAGTVTVAPRPVETVTLPERVETFSLPDPAPVDDSDLTARPSVRASVAEWRSYGRTGGLGDAVDGMTKQQLIDHYKTAE
jgi:hypothetical protein